MRRLLVRLCPFLLFCLCLYGCAPTAPDAAMVAERLGGLPLPVGTVYLSDAEIWEREHLPEAVADVLLGGLQNAEGQEKYRDFCIYLSADGETVAEFVLADCYTTAEAEALAARLALRLAEVRQSLGTDFCPDAEVRLSGRTVLYLATPCNAALLDACR